MNRYKVTISYDGSEYKGWQSQPHGNSVQQVVEHALYKMYHQSVDAIASGRTDTNVHALGQVFHFDAPFMIASDGVLRGLNSLLPADIRVVMVQSVDSSFHARYSAKKKTYRYLVNVGPYDLFSRKYQYQYHHIVDVAKIQAVLDVFIGQHDFTSFNTTTLQENHNQVRTITKFTVTQKNQTLVFEITGNGFLRYMVRMLVGTLLEVGRGRLSRADVETMLAKQEKGVCRYKADACGLYLVAVTYDGPIND